MTTTKFVLDLLGGVQAFTAFHSEPHERVDIAYERVRKPSVLIPDIEAVELVRELTGCDEPAQIASVEKNVRDAWLAKLRERGLPIKQIARITGVGRNIVQRARNAG